MEKYIKDIGIRINIKISVKILDFSVESVKRSYKDSKDIIILINTHYAIIETRCIAIATLSCKDFLSETIFRFVFSISIWCFITF